MKKTIFARIICGVMAATMMLCAVGCGDKKDDTKKEDTKSSENKTEKPKASLRLDVVSTGTQAIPAYVMQKKNLADKYNISLDIHKNSGAWGSEWTAMKTNEVDCIITAWPYVAMNYKDIKTKCVAPMFGWGNSVVAKKDSKIKSLEDIHDLKLGVYQTTALDWVLMCAAAKKQYGFDPSKKNTISEAAAGLLGGMLDHNNIDAALSYADTNVILGATDKYKVLFNMGDCLDTLGLDKKTPFLFYTFSEDYYNKNPEAIKSFTAMYEEVYDILMKDDDIWNDIASDCFGVKDKTAVPALRDTIRACILKKNTSGTQAECQKMLDWCIDNGYKDLIGISSLPDNFITTQDK